MQVRDYGYRISCGLCLLSEIMDLRMLSEYICIEGIRRDEYLIRHYVGDAVGILILKRKLDRAGIDVCIVRVPFCLDLGKSK